MTGWAGAYVRQMDRIADWVGLIAMYLIFLMIAVLLLDVVTQNLIRFVPVVDLFSGGLTDEARQAWTTWFNDMVQNWCVEFAQFTLAAYYFLGGAKTLKDNDHVRMDLFYSALSERGRARMDVATVGCLIFYLFVMLWGSISSLQYAIETGERRFSEWNPSTIPIKVLMVGCIILMILQAFSLLIKYVAAARGRAIA